MPGDWGAPRERCRSLCPPKGRFCPLFG